jgi:hypothetical protein
MSRSPIATVRSLSGSIPTIWVMVLKAIAATVKDANKAKRNENRPRFACLTDGSAKKDRQNRQRTWRGDRDNAGKESEEKGHHGDRQSIRAQA